MAKLIMVTIVPVPGGSSRVIAGSEEERRLVEAALAASGGCVVEVKEAIGAARAEAEATESEDVAADGQEEEEPTCELEPEKPWEESICGKLAHAAADEVMVRLREQGLEK